MAEKNVTATEKELERELEGWNPLRMMDPLREFRLFPLGGLLGDAFAPLRMNLPAAWMPRTDIKETEKDYVLDVALPGVKKEDVRVEVKNDVLTISGEKKSEKEEKGKTWLRRESSFGSFQRSFALPEGLRTEDVKASFKDGVLTLTMPKPAEVKTRGVSIKVD
ncbi:MAG TPA: Hsp20/alpha crystallin family protein [Elusimicrobiota bacterium]|jgi:HSP20 family protein|nr:Hsp20/alpha crystallin family protein [Elusimicrobiota bacterium]